MSIVIDPELKRVTEEAMKLSTQARAALAASLLRSLDGPEEPDAQEAWRREIARRIRETDEGRSQPIPWAIARREIFGS
jgi:putative addiction module component (TIGR02574 family)